MIQERKIRVLICRRTTVHRWMRLGLKPKMRQKNSSRGQMPYELSHVASHFSRHEHSFGNLTNLIHRTGILRYESHRIIESLGNLLYACMNSSFCMPVLHSDCSHAWNSHSDHSEVAPLLRVPGGKKEHLKALGPNGATPQTKEASTARGLSLERRLKHRRPKTADDAFPSAVPKSPRGGMGARSAPPRPLRAL